LQPQRLSSKFCYDRLNISIFANKNAWVPNVANPRGPKRNGFQSTPLVFYVGVGSHNM